MATGRARDADMGSAAPAPAPAGTVGHVLAASAVRLLEQDADVGDAQTQQAVDDAVEAIAARLIRLADLCHGTPLTDLRQEPPLTDLRHDPPLTDLRHDPPRDEGPPPRVSWPRRRGGRW